MGTSLKLALAVELIFARDSWGDYNDNDSGTNYMDYSNNRNGPFSFQQIMGVIGNANAGQLNQVIQHKELHIQQIIGYGIQQQIINLGILMLREEI